MKFTIEITAEHYIYRLFDKDGDVIWEKKNVMESAGRSRAEGKTPDIYDHLESLCVEDELADELAEGIEDISLGPFGVAIALYKMRELGCEI